MRQKKEKCIWIEDNYNVFPSEKDSYPCFNLFVEDECINEMDYEELLSIRDMINRIEQRYQAKGGAR